MSDKTRVGEDVFAGDSYIRRTVKGRRKISPSEEKYPRKTYRLLPGLHDQLKEIAEKEGVQINDLVRYILVNFVEQWKAGEVNLPVKEKTIEIKELVY